MIPIVLGLIARVAAVAVIPRVVKALSLLVVSTKVRKSKWLGLVTTHSSTELLNLQNADKGSHNHSDPNRDERDHQHPIFFAASLGLLGTGAGITVQYNYSYDNLSQLIGVNINNTPAASFQFDPAGNLLSLTAGNTTTTFTANNLNQRTSPGVNVYDAKGQTTDKDGRTFEWDDDGRMTAIVDGTHRSEFGFDGYGRRIKIAEFDNGVITSKKLYWWLGGKIVTEREGLTAGFPITKQYFADGVIANGIKLYYTWDQLGSVRELIDSTGAVRADYRHTSYGERTKESGDLDSDFGYAGLFHHGPSGLDLATYRTYDSAQGRWNSRDPLGEGVDYNLYRYVGNNPISGVDPVGLEIVVYTNIAGKFRTKFAGDLDAYNFIQAHKCNVTRIDFIGHGDPQNQTTSVFGSPNNLEGRPGLHVDPYSGRVNWQVDEGGGQGPFAQGVPRNYDFGNLASSLPNLRGIYLRGCNTAGGQPAGSYSRGIDIIFAKADPVRAFGPLEPGVVAPARGICSTIWACPTTPDCWASLRSARTPSRCATEGLNFSPDESPVLRTTGQAQAKENEPVERFRSSGSGWDRTKCFCGYLSLECQTAQKSRRLSITATIFTTSSSTR